MSADRDFSYNLLRNDSSIGPQWRSRIQHLKNAAEKASRSGAGSVPLNVKLHKC
ncbi:polymorphic toxin type 15 domain-containing protein [Pseudomonas sp. LFS044]|uniref:polymorphic toxin type 15 domain-containing protein n=1 Tax=Pseudomonas sp. LFS044 TaxID=3229880 RepID=UPI003A808E76